MSASCKPEPFVAALYIVTLRSDYTLNKDPIQHGDGGLDPLIINEQAQPLLQALHK